MMKATQIIVLVAITLLLPPLGFARDIEYTDSEMIVFVKPGEPTQVEFPGTIGGGFKRENSSLALDRQEKHLIIFAQPHLGLDGEAIIVHLADKRTYALRVMLADEQNGRDGKVRIIDDREYDLVMPEDETPEVLDFKKADPATTVPGFMRALVLRAEFGSRDRIPPYRVTSKYAGEVVLHDGAIMAKIDEILMGPRYWGYVLTVENLLETTQRINPATFQIDGTRAVSASNWQLAPRPLTGEQHVRSAHQTKVYVITRARARGL